jgi:hypothetical protein
MPENARSMSSTLYSVDRTSIELCTLKQSKYRRVSIDHVGSVFIRETSASHPLDSKQ